MDDRLRTRFSSQVRQAAPVLFTGAGFSAGARTPDDDSLPDARTLTEGLWEVVFPGEPFEDSTLGKVYEAGLRTAGKRTTDFVRKSLTVDPRSLPEWYRAWFSFPWHRIYTVNIDDLADAADRAFDLPREIRPISALTDTVPTVGDMHLQVVHLNGQIAELPDVTFSPRQYGERLSRPDPWYAALARDLKLHPVVFVGTALDEPPLWMYIEARGAKPPGRETRPGSYLVTPKLDRASLVTLGGLNVDWVSGTAESFSEDVLIEMEGEADEGLKRIRLRTRQEESGPVWLDVAAIGDDSKDDEREFLMGREPRWSDISGGYAFARSFDEILAQRVQDEDPRLVVISGTAGVGKSTSAMRFVLNAVAEGASAAMLNPTNYARHREIRNAASATNASLLFIDDVARFGAGARDLVEDLLIDNPDSRLVICARSGRMEALGSLVPDGVPVVEASVPSLEPSDIELLLDALDNANRLGALKGKTRKQQCEVVEKRCGRQLLVAMLEITSNVRFHQKVESECAELEGDAARAYAAATVATHQHASLTDDELVMACDSDPSSAMSAIDRLIARHLLVRDSNERIAVRHRVVADHAVTYYLEQGAFGSVVAGLILALAAGARPGPLKSSRQGRLLMRMLNHAWLVRHIYQRKRHGTDAEREQVRGVYAAVEGPMASDYHYWLQRGSFETEDGDLNLARNFLEQARSMASEDLNVMTQWSYMTLKRASRFPEEGTATNDVAEAFDVLEDVIDSQGDRDYYPFHVYGSQGLAWANRGPHTQDEKKRLLERLQLVVDDGLSRHPGGQELRQLQRDIKRAYLELALP